MTSEMMATVLETLGEYFRSPLTVPAARAYAMGLEDLTDEQLQRAAKQAIKECKFMPTAAELLTFAGAARDLDFEALTAWTAVRRAVDEHDHPHSVDFGVLVNAAVRAVGGWQYLCDAPLNDLDVWARKEFLRVFPLLAAKDLATLEGEPHRGSVPGPVYRIAIGGELPPVALPPVASPVYDLVRELAEAKSQTGAAPSGAREMRAAMQNLDRPAGTPGDPLEAVAAAPPPREVKPKAPLMTDAEVEARKVAIAAQFAARGVA